jgi:hypothetical protein
VITPDTYVECKIGVSHWQSEGMGWAKIGRHDIPEVLLMLQERGGYSREFCRKMLIQHYKDYQIQFPYIRTYLRFLKQWLKGSALPMFL